MRKFVSLSLCGVLIMALVLLTQAQMSDKAQLGRELFHDPTFKGTIDPSKATGLACADCHADFDDTANPDSLIRAGHSMVGVPHRGEAKRGMIKGADFAPACCTCEICAFDHPACCFSTMRNTYHAMSCTD